ncbi:hypothetical protein [Streptomyces sp. B21-105]|uniref:hypothetical protein n=1 Tax=Streptomyces sp. B21-105 TaxID=3039417 RepID=UPI003FA6CC10
MAVCREFGTGPDRGRSTSSAAATWNCRAGPRTRPRAERAGPPRAPVAPVADAAAAHDELRAKGVEIARPPVKEPWGLIELWIAGPGRDPRRARGKYRRTTRCGTGGHLRGPCRTGPVPRTPGPAGMRPRFPCRGWSGWPAGALTSADAVRPGGA